MNKIDFLLVLHEKLIHLPKNDMEERLNFYNEMIEDKIEEGLSEKEAVSSIGSVDEIAKQIQEDMGYISSNNTSIMPRKNHKVWKIVLLILGAPIWLSLLIAAFAIILSLYISIWAAIISLWAVFASLIGCALGAIICGCGYCFNTNGYAGLALIAAGIICTGLSIFLFFGCKFITNYTIILTKKAIRIRKNQLNSKEAAK